MGQKATSSDAAELSGARSPTDGEVLAQMERILASPEFPASERRGSLLRYLLEEAVAGRGNLLKGYTIATAVLNRGEDFDPQTDPVVRFEARRLRQDLDSYYVSAGSQDRVRISIPKGAYVPSFEFREVGAEPAQAALPDIVEDDSVDKAPPNKSVGDPEIGHRISGVSSPGALKWYVFAIAAGIFVVVALGYSLWTQKSVGSAEAMAGHGTSLIVMPFEGIDENADNGLLAAGITQEVISNLMRFPDFRLYSVPATFRQNPKADPSTVGHEVGVSYVVNGSVRGDGDRVRVGAQLVDVGTGEILWTTIFDRDRFPGDLLELPRDLSASIASELGQPYGVIKTHVIDGISQSVNPSMPSYDCVLRAYVYRRSFSEDLYEPTLDCLKAATQRDPRYAEAWALLGWLYLDTARFDLVPLGDKEHFYALATDAASKAVAADRTNVMGLKALAAINHYTGHYPESERFQLRALELNPNDPDTLAQLGWRLAVRGRFDEGVPYMERAIARSVNPPGWYFHLIVVSLYLQGRFPEMLNLAKRSAVEDSALSWSFIAIADAELGNMREAKQALARMAEIDPLLGRDPAGVYRGHQATDAIVSALMEGLHKAGWQEPRASNSP